MTPEDIESLRQQPTERLKELLAGKVEFLNSLAETEQFDLDADALGLRFVGPEYPRELREQIAIIEAELRNRK